MHSSVNSFLGFDGGCIPNREFVVIGQTNDKGSFLLHQIVSAAVKENKPVCLISFTQKFHHYNTVSQKIGTNLQSAVGTDQFKFFDGVEECSNVFYPQEPSSPPRLTDLLDILKEKIHKFLSMTHDFVLVIDELSALISLGFHVSDVCMFMKDLQQTVLGTDSSSPQQNGSSMVVLCSYDEEDRESLCLWQFLVNLSTVDVNVAGLKTGYCKDVHGQACVTWRNSMDAPGRASVTTKTRQFKLMDNNVEFFAAGTSAAVL